MRYSNSATTSSRFEPRTLLISILLLSLSLTSFKPSIAIVVLIVSTTFNVKRIGNFKTFLPVVLSYLALSTIFGGIRKFPTFVSLISLSLFLTDVNVEELISALTFFKFPPKFAYSIAISVRFFQNVLRDFEDLRHLKRFEGFGHLELLKRLTNLVVLKAIAMAESMESRGIKLNRGVRILRRPKKMDIVLLLISFSVFILSFDAGTGI